jgi:lysophospholipase L1-like esterase
MTSAREWAGRLLLVVVSPLLFLAAVEAVVTAVYGELDYPLPGIEEAARYLHFTMPERYNPLFELDADSVAGDEGWFRTRPELWDRTNFLVRDQRFPARRTPQAVRVAFIGGSSVQGWPYREAGASFADVVGSKLQERFPDRRIDVLNAGVGAYSSFQLIDVAWQVRNFDPDVVVVYAGHNDQGYYLFHREFLEQAATNKPANLEGVERFLNRFNFYQAARRLRDKGAVKPIEGVQVTHRKTDIFVPQEEYVDYVGRQEYADFVRIQQRYLPELFARNLQDVVTTLQDEDTTVILAPPVSNLRDIAPAFSMPWDAVSQADQARIDRLTETIEAQLKTAGVGPRVMRGIPGNGESMRWGGNWEPDFPEGSHPVGSPEAVEACKPLLELVEKGKAISPTWAWFHYIEGTCRLHDSPRAARKAFVQARDLSPALPPKQRASTTMQAAVKRVARKTGAEFVDLPAAFEAAAEFGVPGGEYFVDTLHFTKAGADVVADALVPAVAKAPALKPGWERRPDPPATELWRRVQVNSRQFRWGMDLDVPGAGEAKLGPDSDPLATPQQNKSPDIPGL